MGYKLGQVGTEPTAPLFGMDVCFPSGYNSTVSTSRYNTISYLNYQLKNLCYKDVDLILVGCQSYSLPDEFGNLDNYPLAQFEFLLGTCPDIVVLCINGNDSLSLIQRTIKFIESSIDCKIIAFVLFPYYEDCNYLDKYTERKYVSKEIITKLSNELPAYPIYRLDNFLDLKLLSEDIINYFSE